MDEQTTTVEGERPAGSSTLALMLAAAMFVLVVDTSLMNVSIAAVVRDLDTTVSGVQGAIALEALVSAAFILVGSKIADLIGRKRAFIIGLLAYATGALAMTLGQSLTAVIIFWAVIGGFGASLLLPSMQALIHGNFSGASQKKTYALVGAASAVAAAVGPLLGGFLTTYVSWRAGFLLEVVVILVVVANAGRIGDVAYTGPREIDTVGAVLSALGMGGVVIGVLVWQEGGEFVGLLIAIGLVALGSLARWLVRRKAAGKPILLDPALFSHALFRLGITSQMLQNITLGGAMIALPIFLQMVLEYNAMQTGLTIAPLSLTMFAAALFAGRKLAAVRPATVIRGGWVLAAAGFAVLLFLVPHVDSGLQLLLPLAVIGAGLGLLVSQLNNYTLSPIENERVAEAAGVNSAAGSFGLSFGLAFGGAILLATLSIAFTQLSDSSTVLPPEAKTQVAQVLEEDAEVLSNTALEQQLEGEPEAVQDEIVAINTEARPLALQVALGVPLIAALIGLGLSLRMRRLPDPEPSEAAELQLGG